MKDKTGKIFGIAALTIACIALFISLTHKGPSGPIGPKGNPGNAGKSATISHLGICELNGTEWFDQAITGWENMGAQIVPTGIPNVITAPSNTNGVPSCPIGSFVSIVPGQ